VHIGEAVADRNPAAAFSRVAGPTDYRALTNDSLTIRGARRQTMRGAAWVKKADSGSRSQQSGPPLADSPTNFDTSRNETGLKFDLVHAVGEQQWQPRPRANVFAAQCKSKFPVNRKPWVEAMDYCHCGPAVL
jgi:hypothetical protein